jgi:alpha-N-arabinofuranosidase
MGSGTPQEMREWVEYCNYPEGSTLAEERIANGAREPFNVKYWGVGNENWGCGGQMMPEEYAGHYRRFATYMRPFGGTRPFLVACGPNSNNLDWTRRFFDTLGNRSRPSGYAMHFYSNGKSQATKFTVETMQEQLSSFARMEKAVLEQRELMDKYDSRRAIGLMVDEWGVWDRMVPEEEKRYGRLFQQITMRSAVAAAMGLNVFHRQADKLVMCNIAQTVNVLHALLLVDGPRTVRTTTYHAHDLLKAHRDKTAVKVETGDTSPLGVSVSASRQGNTLVLTCVNPKHDTALSAACDLSGASAVSATARILQDPDYNACNEFENPNRIVPKQHPVEAKGAKVAMELPPLSIVTAEIRLG